MDWLSEIVFKRKSQRSTVFIVETLDNVRLNQFLKVNHNQLFERNFYTVIQYDVLRGSLMEKHNVNGEIKWREIDIDEPPLTYIDNNIRSKTSLIIIHYIYSPDQASALSNYLLSWAIDNEDKIYGKHSTIVVFTSSMSHFSETVRKFCYTLSVIASTPEERRKLIKNIVEDVIQAYTLKEGEQKSSRLRRYIKPKEEYIMASAGLDLHMVESATLESIYMERRIKTEYYTKYKIDFLRQFGIEYIKPSYGFEAVGGYQLLKQYVQNRIIKLIKTPEIAEKYSLTPPRGIIMFGLPGVGKTFFAKALAREIGLTMIKIDPSTFLRGIVGETESRVKQITNIIESFSPVVVFIDEIDQIAMARGRVMATDSGVSRRLTNMLLDWLGDRERKSIIIGATNFISDLDPAFIRPGRIDELIPILLPDEEARREIFKIHTAVLRKLPLDKDVDLNELAGLTYAYTGAEIEKLVVEAGFKALEDGTVAGQRQFKSALETIEIDVDSREKQLSQLLSEARKLENINKAFLKELVEHYSKRESKAKLVADLL